MTFNWLGRPQESQEEPLYEAPPPDDEVERLRAQVQDLTRRLEGCEETGGRLEGVFELFNQTMTEVHLQLQQLRQDLRSEQEARLQLEKLVEAQRPVADEEWDIPAQPPPPPQLSEWSRSAERILAAMLEVGKDAPESLRKTLEATAQEAQSIGRRLKGPLKRGVDLRLDLPTDGRKSPVIKKLREQVREALAVQGGSPQELERLHARLIRQLVPEYVELLEAGQRAGDPNLPFFRSLEERLTALIQAAGLEELRPAPGTMYRPTEQNLLKAKRSDDPRLRDQIERCVSRGFRYQGELVKKAEVTVYL